MYHIKSAIKTIQLAGKTNQIQIALNAFENALRLFPNNPWLYNNMITAAGRCQRLDIAFNVYKTATENGSADEVTHRGMLTAIGKEEDSALFDKVYPIASSHTYTLNIHAYYRCVMVAASACDRYEITLAVYKELGVRAQCKSHSIMIQAAGKHKDLQTAKEAYTKGLLIDPSSTDIIKAFILAAGLCENVELATTAFRKAIEKNAVDVYTCTIVISVAEKHDLIELALEAYLFAKKSNLLTDKRIHMKMMNAVMQTGREDLLEQVAEIAFSNCRKQVLPELQAKYSQVKTQLSRYKSWQHNTSESSTKLDKNLAVEGETIFHLQPTENPTTLNNPIKIAKDQWHTLLTPEIKLIKEKIIAAGQERNLSKAASIYYQALSQGIINPFVFNVMIKAASECEGVEAAWEIYQTACTKPGGTDSISHSTMITIAGKKAHSEYVSIAYDRACEAGYEENLRVNNEAIKAFGNCDNKIDESWKIYKAVCAKPGNADIITHCTMLTIAGKQGHSEYVGIAYDIGCKTGYAENLRLNNEAIMAFGNCDNRIEKSWEIYETLCAKPNSTDSFTHTIMITIAGKKGRIEYIDIAYDRACKAGYGENLRLNNETIMALSRCDNTINTAWSIYKKLIRLGVADEYTFTNIMAAAEFNQRMDLLKEAYEESIIAHPTSSHTHQIVIKAAAKIGHIALLEQAFDNAIKVNAVTPELKEIYRVAKIISKNSPFQTLNSLDQTKVRPTAIPEEKGNDKKQAYRLAVQHGFANKKIHKEMLEQGGENNDMDLALSAYMNGLVDADSESALDLHLSMIKAAKANNRADLAAMAKKNILYTNGNESKKASPEVPVATQKTLENLQIASETTNTKDFLQFTTPVLSSEPKDFLQFTPPAVTTKPKDFLQFIPTAISKSGTESKDSSPNFFRRSPMSTTIGPVIHPDPQTSPSFSYSSQGDEDQGL